MTELEKPLSEDILKHLDLLYRTAMSSNNIALALKAVEVCLKAKKTLDKEHQSILNIQEVSDDELEKMVKQLQDK